MAGSRADWKRNVQIHRHESLALMSTHKLDQRVVDECQRAGSSIAVVDGDLMIPLVPRHLQDKHLRALFWLQVKELIIYGQNHGDLCGVCMNNISCLQDGLGVSAMFKCTAKTDLVTIALRKKKGEGHGRESKTGS
jgi:hypothetical protein